MKERTLRTLSFRQLTTILSVLVGLSTVADAMTIRFSDDVTPQSMNKLISRVAAAHQAGDRNITIELNSNGGNLGSALTAFAQIKRYGANTLVKRLCASSCTVLFAAGATRSASNSARFMFHAVHVEHIAKKLRYNKKKNVDGVTKDQVAEDYANRWLMAVRSASPALASQLERKHTLISGRETYFSGRALRKLGYVND
jgi:hypothetical protein